ncbi:MAG: hypothetical protein A2Y62_15510 [Candidatus Fischerbacteria bacterium RBG_13_37_8]|uniref:Fibronectin type-III domain-containing protein n=1 Tax=Candidatus Fischerbacteria bacterium RBG_13_37_8 TaxID=1817863 RepID=A0A1F5VKY9_9BACT|nr:MAG: hypothetical protein A2Y62_15510 [Candidatus Fischerbacteria bacterium RBG_13_37_8]
MKKISLMLLIIVMICSCSGDKSTTPLINKGDIPFPLTPDDGAVVANYSVTLIVKNAVGYDGSQSKYLFQVSPDKNFSSVIFEQEIEGGSGSTSLTISQSFDGGAGYYWRAKASNTTNSTAFSTAFMFVIQSMSTPPEPVSPGLEKVEINGQLTLRVKNSPYFTSEYDYYKFELYRMTQPLSPINVKDVKSQSEFTQVSFKENYPEGAYKWRARAYHVAGGDIESTQFSEFITFYIAEPCSKFNGSTFAVRLVQSNVTCGIYNSYQNAYEALGPPDAAPVGTDEYRGFVSLGIDGWIVFELGQCIKNMPNSDVEVYQTVSYEGVGVAVAETPDGPWHWLGIRKCFDHTPYYSFACFFDLSHDGATTPWARYVKVYDYMRYTMPEWAVCELDPPHPGADIDAVEAIHVF